jgi:Domain of unknown function (DUF4337)
MSHSHAEEAEHQSQHAHDPFDRRVALTMVIIAAMLAAVKVAGHRASVEALLRQIQANVEHTHESDTWAFFQAQKIRQHQYQSQIDLLTELSREGKFSSQAQERIKNWTNQVDKYKSKAEDLDKEANGHKAKGIALRERSEEMHHCSDFFDLGEMGIEIGLVLCSLAILARQRYFWYGGIGLAAVGLVVALIGLLPAKHAKEHGGEKEASRPAMARSIDAC